MAKRIMTGGVAAVAQVERNTIGGTIEADDRFITTIGDKVIDTAAGGTTATIARDAHLAALQASQEPEFLRVTWQADSTDAILATALTPGVPYIQTPTTTEAGGGAADAQTFVKTVVQVNRSPADISDAENWDGGAALPVASDELYLRGAVNAKYGLAAFAAIVFNSIDGETSFAGQVGLPETNTEDPSKPFREYLPTYWQSGVTKVRWRAASSIVRFDFGAAAATVDIYDSAVNPSAQVAAIQLLGANVGNVCNVNKGQVGLAQSGGESASWTTLRVGQVANATNDARVVCGDGCTLATIKQTGGQLETNSAVTSTNKSGGTWDHRQGIGGTIVNSAGAVNYISSGIVDDLQNGGVFSRAPDANPMTVSKASVSNGGRISDPGGSVTWTLGIDLPLRGLADGALDLGKNINVNATALP